MTKIISNIALLLTMTIIASCSHKIERFFPERSSIEFDEDTAKASPDFKQGWDDGCEVGQSAGGNTFYKMFRRNNVVDGYKSAYSPDYRTAWNNAFWWCYRRDYIKQKSSIWGSTFKGHI